MTATYDLIASNVLTSSASSVTFSSIPATYRDLIVVANGGATGFSGLYRMRFNSDTGSNYSWVYMSGNGSSTLSSSNTQTSFGFSSAYAATPPTYLAITQIMDYSATDKHKTVLHRGNDAASGVDAFAGRWANTAAITTVEITTTNTNTFSAGSSFYLYAIVS